VDDLALHVHKPTFTAPPGSGFQASYHRLHLDAIGIFVIGIFVLLYRGAKHCFIHAELVSLLQLPHWSSPGPKAVRMAFLDTTRALPPPVGIHLILIGSSRVD
jgi:hypothetical protein